MIILFLDDYTNYAEKGARFTPETICSPSCSFVGFFEALNACGLPRSWLSRLGRNLVGAPCVDPKREFI